MEANMDNDMSSMMGSMDSMDMGSSGLFRTQNLALARLFWYILVGVVAFGLVWRAVGVTDTFLRRRRCLQKAIASPTRPTNAFWQWYATITAIAREITYPTLLFIHPWLDWLSPPPLGRSLLVVFYWSLILGLLLSNSVVFDAYYWERVGFRAAWISITQIPLVYLLASKNNIIGLLIGLSYERLNWLHRWVSRTLLITATIHGSFFLREWVIADFVVLELEIMPMVKYGLGAWAILAWTFISSIRPFRRLSYEFFVLQHLVAAVLLLWILYVHVPAYAQYNVWFAVTALSLDFAIKGGLTIYCNYPKSSAAAIWGHPIELVSSEDDWTAVNVRDVRFSWVPGQHIYLWLPFLGPLETHPFTVVNAHQANAADSNHIQLVVRTHQGFSRRLHKHAGGHFSPPGKQTIGFVRGPYGVVPAWDSYESLVLISSSTGASFTYPVLQHLMRRIHRGNVRRIIMLLIAQRESQISWYTERLDDFATASRKLDVDLQIRVAITRPLGTSAESQFGIDLKSVNSATTSTQKETVHIKYDLREDSEALIGVEGPFLGIPWFATREFITSTYGRPDIGEVIRQTVERSSGETLVAVCGGREVTTAVRNSVARLSDERAVHKGTGAQGIRLHVEDFQM